MFVTPYELSRDRPRLGIEHARTDVYGIIVVEDPDLRGVPGGVAFNRTLLHKPAGYRRVLPRLVIKTAVEDDPGCSAGGGDGWTHRGRCGRLSVGLGRERTNLGNEGENDCDRRQRSHAHY